MDGMGLRGSLLCCWSLVLFWPAGVINFTVIRWGAKRQVCVSRYQGISVDVCIVLCVCIYLECVQSRGYCMAELECTEEKEGVD